MTPQNAYELKLLFLRNAVQECLDHAVARKFSNHHKEQLRAVYASIECVIYDTEKSDNLLQQ